MKWYRTVRGNPVYWRSTVIRQSWLGYWLLNLGARIDGVKTKTVRRER